MRRIWLFLLFSHLFFVCSCSEYKTFENYLIKLYYPVDFREAVIENASHMLVKLESEETFFSISYWDYNIEKGVDAWSNLIYEQFKNGLPGTDCIFSEKVILNTKNEKLRAIKLLANIQNASSKVGSIAYLFVKNGDLYLATYIQSTIVTQNSTCANVDKLLQGLVLKSEVDVNNSGNFDMSIEEFEDYMLNLYKKTNQTLPMKIDEVTTLFNITSVGKTIIFKYRVETYMSSYMNDEWENNFKEKTILNILSSVPDADIVASYIAKSSLRMVYTFFDDEDNLIRTIKITSEDFKL